MTLLPFMPPPGIVSDDTTFSSEGRWADGDGFRFRRGKPQTIHESGSVAGAADTTNVNKLMVFDNSGTNALAIAGDALKAGNIGSGPTTITPASGWTTGFATRRCLQMFGNVLLASVSGGKLFESAALATATEVTAAPDNITCMIVTPSRQVMALGCNEETSGTFNGRCIRWCDIEDYTDWTTTATNNAGEYILPGQADIVSGCVHDDFVIIWTETSMWLGQFVGDPTQTFTFTRISDHGISGLDAWAIYKNTLYFLSPRRALFAYQIGGIPQRIPCPIESEFTYRQAAVGDYLCAIPRFGEIWLCLATTTVPDRYYAYCVEESQAFDLPVWFKGTFAKFNGLIGANTGIGAMVDSQLLASAIGSSTIGHGTGGSSPRPAYVDYIAAGSVITGLDGPNGAYIETNDFYFDESERRVQIQGAVPDFEYMTGAVDLTIYVRDYPLQEATTKGPYRLRCAAALVSGQVVDSSISSGDNTILCGSMDGPMPAGATFTFEGVNAYAGGDTGQLAVFTLTADFDGNVLDQPATLTFTPAMISSGGSRNVVALPANLADINATSRPEKKKDFRASGKIFRLRFTSGGDFSIRFGKLLFPVVMMGER